MMFFDDEQLVRKKASRLAALPPVPETGWTPPREFPNLDAAVAVAFDTETFDPDLNEAGPGWARGRGHVVGYSLSAVARDGSRGDWYFPMRHEVEGHDNLDPVNAIAYAKHVLENPHTDKIGANLTYDIGWLSAEGVNVAGPLYDVQFAEACIDNNGLVNLDHLGEKYCGRGKDTNLLYQWCADAYGGKANDRQRANIFRSPPRLVGPYAMEDTALPIDVFRRQMPILQREDLWRVFRLECDIIPLMIAMRWAGVYVNLDKAARLYDELQQDTKQLYESIRSDYGFTLESTDSRQIAKLFDFVGIGYPKTAMGAPSITKDWLADHDHPLSITLNDIREHEKMCGTFIDGYIFKKNVNGYLYPSFHQMKGEDGGTNVGRFASYGPNLQNIPARSKLGKRVRECFEHDPGHFCWKKGDYSQIHYRILAHNAVGPGADELRAAYRNDPKMDYHDKVYYNVCPFMGWDETDDDAKDFRRRPIKNVNFGLLYGQSVKSLIKKTAAYFGGSFTEAQGQAFVDAYFKGAPYVKPTMKAIAQEVQQNGFVTTLLGRRIRFEMFEPANNEDRRMPLRYEAALRTYGAPLKYAYDYRGVNYKFQGTEPDIMKTGMLKCWLSGVFDVTGVPRLTVHDELDWSVRDDSPQTREAFAFIKYTMEHAVEMRVPVYVDMNDGANWAKAK